MLRPELTPPDGIGGGAPAKVKPEKPDVPLVVFTAFDADTAEALSERLQNTVRPADNPAKVEYDPLSSIQAPAQSSERSLPEFTPDIEEPEIGVADAEIPWSSEAPFLSLDAAEMSYYFSAQEDELTRGVAMSLQHEKFILHYLDDPLAYLKHFATYTWDEESDKAAEEFIQWYVNRFRSELEEQWEYDLSGDTLSDVEYWITRVANDERESVIVYDLEAGETLFVRYGDENSVTMQKLHRTLAEGRNIFVIHNHPNNTGASLADLSAVAWLDAEYMLVVNPDGTLHRYARVGEALIPLEPTRNPEYVAAADPIETLAADVAYLLQTWSEIGNPPEMVMRQGQATEEEYTINMDSRLVKDFFFDPAAIVFLEDVAKEYEVEDPLLHNAMVYTIIYRELSARGSLENADNPAYQSNWDFAKSVSSGVWLNFGLPPISKLDKDPSLGIGALNRQALHRIEQDARKQRIDIYAPLLGYDMPSTLSNVPFSKGIHEREAVSARTLHLVNYEYQHRVHRTTVIPPSNEQVGAWRIELADFTESDKQDLFSGRVGGSIQQLYEPTLGIIAAEVTLAMRSPLYQKLKTDPERITYIIGYHANRSAPPGEHIFDLTDIEDDSRKATRTEIRWAEDFEELVDEHRREIKRRTQEK